MQTLYELLHDLHLLRAKGRLVPLSCEEHARERGLERLLSGDCPPAAGRREHRRFCCPVPVQLTGPGAFGEGRVEELSAAGARVRSTRTFPAGARLLLHFADDVNGVEYSFPARVVWTDGPRMGLCFDGVPSRDAIYEPFGRGSGRYRRMASEDARAGGE